MTYMWPHIECKDGSLVSAECVLSRTYKHYKHGENVYSIARTLPDKTQPWEYYEYTPLPRKLRGVFRLIERGQYKNEKQMIVDAKREWQQ